MTDHPLNEDEIAEIIEEEKGAVIAALERFNGRYEGIEIRHIAGGYEFTTKSECGEYIAKLYEPPKMKLSQAAMETLAITAYRQPVTRAEIEHLRGVNSDKIILSLVDKGFLTECGQKDTIGHPMMYGITDKFLKYFGMSSSSDLPPIENFLEEDRHNMLEGYTDSEE